MHHSCLSLRGFHQKASNSISYLQNTSIIIRYRYDTHHWYQCITHCHSITVAEEKEVYTYMGSVCETFESIKEIAVWSTLLQYISSRTCEAICSHIATRNCFSILYHRGNKTCMMSSHAVSDQQDPTNLNGTCGHFEYYKRQMRFKSIG